MDFLKEIVKEIGDEYTQIASDIDETERFIDTGGSYIFKMRLLAVPFMVAFLVIRLLPSLVKPLLERLTLPLLLSRTFWTLNLMGIDSILILKLQSPRDYLSSRGIDQNETCCCQCRYHRRVPK